MNSLLVDASSRYTIFMEVIFRASAFKHGYEESDFFELLASKPIKRRSQRGITNVYELFGQTFAGDYLHVIYKREQDSHVVLHMNRMNERQKTYYRKNRK